MWKDTLVIGKALDPHTFDMGKKDQDVELTGLTSPWNTFAIWDLRKLAKVRLFIDLFSLLSYLLQHYVRQTGFLPVSDTNTTPGQSAIEEAPTIALQQLLFPSSSRATLVKFPSDAGWDTKWFVLCYIIPS